MIRLGSHVKISYNNSPLPPWYHLALFWLLLAHYRFSELHSLSFWFGQLGERKTCSCLRIVAKLCEIFVERIVLLYLRNDAIALPPLLQPQKWLCMGFQELVFVSHTRHHRLYVFCLLCPHTLFYSTIGAEVWAFLACVATSVDRLCSIPIVCNYIQKHWMFR